MEKEARSKKVLVAGEEDSRVLVARLNERVAELERSEEALKRAEQEKAAILDSMSELVAIQDTEHRIIWVNKAAGKSVNLSPQQLVGKYCYEVWPKLDKPCDGCPVDKARKTAKPQEAEMATPDGRVWFIRGYPIKDANGDVTALVEMTLDITERKSSEEALQAEKNKLQSVIDALEDALTIQDRDYNIIYQNELLKEIFGDHLGEKCYRVYEGKEELCPGCPVKKAFKDGKSHASERRVILPSGELTFWENTANPIRDARGEMISCLEVARNITERKQAEEALRESAEKYRELAESITDVFFAFDKDLRYTYWNKASEELTGIPAEDALGKHLLDIFPASGMTKNAEEMYLKALKTRKVQSFVNEFQLRGRNYFFEISAYPSKDGLSVFVKDVTERKLAEEALRESENKYRTIFENVSEVVILLDKYGKIIDINQRVEDCFGYKPEEVIGKNFAKLGALSLKDLPKMVKLFGDIVVRGKLAPFVLELEAKRKDGSPVLIEVENALIKKDGKTEGTVTLIRDITERKKVEQALADEATRRRILVEQSRDGIVVLDQDGKVYEANRRFAEMLGYTPEEVLGLNVWDWEYLFPRERVLEMIRTVDEAGDHFETKHRRKDGSVYDVEISTNGAIFAGQKLIFCVCRDITDRKRAEEAIQVEKNKLQSVIDAMVDHLTIRDRDYNLLYQSESSQEIFGNHLGEKCYRVYEGQDKLCPGCPVKKAFEDGKSHTSVRKTVTPSGEVIFWENTANPIRDARGEIVSCLEVARNITDRKRAEEALKESEEKYKTLVEATSDIIWEVDAEGRFTFISPKIKDILGYEVDEVVGKMRTLDLVAKEEFGKWLKRFKQITAKRKPFSGLEVIHLHKNGHRVICEISGIPLFDSAGEFKGYVGIDKDITERRHMQEQLAITDRLASVGELAAGIAHELNNPLTGVIGFSQLLMEKDVPEDIKQDLHTVYSEAQRAAQVVNNLLTFSRRHPAVKQMLNINEVINKVLELRAYEQRVENIQVKSRFEPGLPEVKADYFQLQQVFLNIIINAEYFMIKEHGSGKLTITTERVGDVIRASFADDGPGIAEEDLGHIFDPFFTTKEVGKGTGLGLSICHGIVTEHGGRLYVESESGKGATFIVELPINAAGGK
jgi:PAS domain S-box-containing protein